MNEATAFGLVDLARADPNAAFEDATRALDDASLDHAVASTVLRAKGIAARFLADQHADGAEIVGVERVRPIELSIDLLNDAVDRARLADRPDLVREAQLTLAGSHYLGGGAQAAFETLDLAADGADDAMVAKVEFQRAIILVREGDPARAVLSCDRALAHFEASDDRWFVASTLGNRGMANLDMGNVRAARRDLEGAQKRFRELRVWASVAWMEHNLGRVDGRRGDIVSALDRFRVSESALSRLKIDTSEVQVNRCEVLLQAGLFEEAEGVAARTESAMETAKLELERAEATLARSLALLGSGRFGPAAEHAERAAALFAHQRRHARSLQANVVELRSRCAAGVEVSTDLAIDVARQLGAAGQHLAAAQAWAVVAQAEPRSALRALRRLNITRRDAPLEFRLTELEILARARLAAADRSGAMGATRAAIELGRRHQLALAATDIRVGVSAQLDAISQLGLTIRREMNRPWDVVRWVDRTRSASLHISSVSPPRAPDVVQLLAELRAVHMAAREAVPADAVALMQRQANLQRRLAAAQRQAALPGHRPYRRALPRRLFDVTTDVTIIQHHRHGSSLGAVVIDKAGARMVDMVPLHEVNRAHEILRHGLSRLIRGRDGALAEVRRDAATMSRLVIPPIDQRPTVVMPLPQHAGLPWSLLPALGDRPVTVAPNLRHWLGSPVNAPAPSGTPTVGIIEGSDLQSSHIEIAGIAGLWSRTESVSATQAGVEAALNLLGRVKVAHLACHCGRRNRDGRFAQLRLRDGDLTAFHLEQLDRTPSLVVLSGCEAGLVDTLPGEESTGLSTALFGRGTHTIIASTIMLPDTANTAALFIDLHARLARGIPPSVALFESQHLRTDPSERAIAQSISCFGRGY